MNKFLYLNVLFEKVEIFIFFERYLNMMYLCVVLEL